MTPEQKADLIANFQAFINRNGMEQFGNVPDFILAEYLVTCLESLKTATEKRDTWHDFDSSNPPWLGE